MPYVPALNTAMAELRFLWSTQKVENTLYFEASAGMSTTLMTNIGNGLVTWWQTNVRPSMSNALTLSEVYLTDLTTQTGPTVSIPVTSNNVGQDVGEALPFNCAFVITLRTANRGKAGRGRNYIPGMTLSSVSSSTVELTFANAMSAAYTALVGAGAVAAGAQLVVVSRFLNGSPRSQALVQPVTSVLYIDRIVDSQRRRLPGRGT